jgi:hypothetical protein
MTPIPPTPSRSAPSRLRALAPPLGAAATFAVAVAWVLTHNPADTIPDPTGGCVWTALTGTQGPTCGGTRMMWYLLHGDLVQAARHHLPALLGVPVAGYAWLRWTASAAGRRLPALPGPRWLLLAYAASWLVFTVARNLPSPPFTWFHLTDIQ